MNIHINIKINVGITEFNELVNALHTDYQYNRKHGYKGTPYDYVKKAVMTFPMMMKIVSYEEVCDKLIKCAKENKVVNTVGETTHYFNILVALSDILKNGLKFKYEKGDILYNPKSKITLIIAEHTQSSLPFYTVKIPAKLGTTTYDCEFVEENFVKIGVSCC